MGHDYTNAIRRAHRTAIGDRVDVSDLGPRIENRESSVWLTRTCDWCGKEFQATGSRAAQRHCKDECKKLSKSDTESHANADRRAASDRRRIEALGRIERARHERWLAKLPRGFLLRSKIALAWPGLSKSNVSDRILELVEAGHLIPCMRGVISGWMAAR
jgi:hypothetical protein